MAELKGLGQKAAQRAIHQEVEARAVGEGKFTPDQAKLAEEMKSGFEGMTGVEARAALADLEVLRPNHDIAQFGGVSLHAPPFLDGQPDDRTFTRIGVAARPVHEGGEGAAGFLITLYDPQGQPASGSVGGTGRDGGDSARLIRLDDKGLKAFIFANRTDELGRAMTGVFKNMAEGTSDEPPPRSWIRPPPRE